MKRNGKRKIKKSEIALTQIVTIILNIYQNFNTLVICQKQQAHFLIVVSNIKNSNKFG